MLNQAFHIISLDEYHHGQGAFADGKSILGKILDSPMHYRYHKDNPEREDIFEKVMVKYNTGTAFHTYFGEPEKFEKEITVYRKFKGPGSVALNEDLKQSIRDSGMIPIQPDILTMLQDFDKMIHSGEYETARNIIENEDNFVEHSGFWEDPETGLWLKTRPDIIAPNKVLWDLKKHASVKSFKSQATELHYDLQAWMGLIGVSILTGIEHDQFGFVVFHAKEKPYDIEIVMADEKMLISGKDKFERATDRLRHCLDTDTWPGKYGDEVGFVGPTYYRLKELERMGLITN